MEDESIYTVKKTKIVKIEDNATYQKYSQSSAKNVPVDDLRIILKLFFDKASVNMGKESYDAPDIAIEAIMEYTYKDYGILPVMYIGMAVIRGSLGKYGPGRLVPNTVYKWLHEMTLEYERMQKHESLKNSDYSDAMDLHKYPAGKAIIKKIEWYNKGIIDGDGWDKIPLKEMAERIGQGLECVPEIFGLISLKPKK